jgi:LuxR family maltose regulon positive regulatory protein
MWLEELQVTRAQILIASDSETDQHLALELLDNLYEIVVRTCNTRYTIEILALRALALDALGKMNEADTELIKAVNLAQLGGFIRIFIDLGRPIQKVLQRLPTQGQSGEYIYRLLEAFQDEGKTLAGGKRQVQMMRQPESRNYNLVEALTPRELEVLNLLRGPSSIKEIAQQLHISYATAKRHTINIYAKLGANQRWNAVARAEELNILPPK